MTTPDLERTARCAACSTSDPVVATAGVSLLADALRDQAVPVTEVDWRPPMAGTEADLARVMADPRRAAANAAGGRADAGRRGRAGRRRARLRGARPRARARSCTPGRRSTGSAPRARCAARCIGAMLFEGLADDPEEAERALAAGDGSTSSRATTAARSARWPASSARRCGCSSCATTCTAHARGARSTRASARCCATAPTAPR